MESPAVAGAPNMNQLQLHRRLQMSRYGGLSGAVRKFGPGAVAVARKSYQLGKRLRQAAQGSASKRVKREAGDRDVITGQSDTKVRFMKRGYSKKARGRAAFAKRVQYAINTNQSLISYTNDNSRAIKTWAVNEQGYDGQMLGAIDSTNNDEVLSAFRVAYDNMALAKTDTTFLRTGVYIKSMCLDTQITNTSTETNCIVDVYQCLLRRDWQANDRIDVQYATTWNSMDNAGLGQINNVATTPFQNAEFLKHWKIISKREIYLQPGASTTLQMRQSRPKRIYGRQMSTQSVGFPGWTKAYFFQYRGCPVNALGVVALASGELAIAHQYTVSVARMPTGQDVSRIQTA